MEFLNGYKIKDRVFDISGRPNIQPVASIKIYTCSEYNSFMTEHLVKFGRVKEIEKDLGHYIAPEDYARYIEYEQIEHDDY